MKNLLFCFYLFVHVPDLLGKFTIVDVVELIVQHQEPTESYKSLSMTYLIGLTYPALKKGKDVANVQIKLFGQLLVLADIDVSSVIDLSDTALHVEKGGLRGRVSE